MASKQSASSQMATNDIITVLLLIFVFPVGVIVMWFLTTWPKWVKITLTVILAIMLLFWILVMGIMGAVFFSQVPQMQEVEKKQQMLDEQDAALDENQEEYMQQIIEGTPAAQ